MADLMISYSRRNVEFVHKLHQRFSDDGRDVWVDWEDIPLNADWWQEICHAIEGSDTIVFTLSPDSISSPICQLELAHAREHNKRLIPIVWLDTNPDAAHAELFQKSLDDNTKTALNGRTIEELAQDNWNEIARLNWIFFRESDDFDKSYAQINETLDTDLDHVRNHTRMLVRATEWTERGKDASYLLEGTEVEEAESWLMAGMSKEPAPTPLQGEYISLSRQRKQRQQRRLLFGVTSSLVVAIILTIISLFLFRMAQQAEAEARAAQAVAEHEAAVARSLLVASNAQLALADNDNELAIALALEANNIQPLAQVQMTLAHAAYAPGTILEKETFPGTDSLTFSADASRAISVLDSGEVVLWETLTDAEILRLGGDGLVVNAAALIDDETLLVATANDMRLYAIDDGTETLAFADASTGQHVFTVNSENTQMLSAGNDSVIHLWDLTDGSLIRTFTPDESMPAVVRINDLGFSPDGLLAASGGGNGQIILWDVEDGTEVMRFRENTLGSVEDIVFSPDGTRLLSGGSVASNSLHLWDVETGALIWDLIGHGDIIYDIDISDDGMSAVSASQDGSIRLWNLRHGVEVHRFAGHTDVISDVIFMPDNNLILSASDGEGVIRMWQLTDGALIQELQAHDAAAYITAYSPDGQYYLSGSADRSVRLWDTTTNELVATLGEHGDAVWGLDFTPDGAYAVSGARDGSATVWDINTQTALHEIMPDPDGVTGHSARIWDVDVSPDGATFLTASDDGTVRQWDVQTGDLLNTFTVGGVHFRAVAYSPDMSGFAAGGSDESVSFWSFETGEIAWTQGAPDNWVWDIVFTPDSTQLAVSSSGDDIYIVEVSNGNLNPTHIAGASGGTTGLALSPDGTVLATASSDGTVRQWSMATGDELRRYVDDGGGVWSLAFTSTGILTSGADGELSLWRTHVPLAQLIDWTQQNRAFEALDCEDKLEYNVVNTCVPPPPAQANAG